jgi:hypothetical protein
VSKVDTDKMEITYKTVTNPGKDQTVGDKDIVVKYAKDVKVTAAVGGGGGRGKGGKGKGGAGGAPPETGGATLLQDRLTKAKDAGRGGVTATLTRDDKSKLVTEVNIRGGGRRGGGGDEQ